MTREEKIIANIADILIAQYEETTIFKVHNLMNEIFLNGATEIYKMLNVNYNQKETMNTVKIKIKLLSTTSIPPVKAKADDSGWDLYADLHHPLISQNELVGYNVFQTPQIVLYPNGIATVSVGFKMEIEGNGKIYEAQVRPRSGLAIQGLSVNNAPGTIDYGYRNIVGVILINNSNHTIVVKHGDRIAQMVIQEVIPTEITLVDELSDTERGEGGFGSTGINAMPPETVTPLEQIPYFE